MPIKKGIKISSAKRGHHEKHKKNFGKSKKTIQKEKQSKNIFKNSKTAQRKDELNSKNSTLQESTKIKSGKNLKNPKVEKGSNKKKIQQNEPMPSGSFYINDVFNGNDSEEEVTPKNNFQNFKKTPKQSDSDSDSYASDDSELSHAEEMEEEHGLKTTSVDNHKKMKELLPFKSKTGVIPRSEEVKKKHFEEVHDKPENDIPDSDPEEQEVENVDEDIDSDAEVIEAPAQKKRKLVSMSAAELMVERAHEVQRIRFKVGVICSGLLEKPEEKIKNLAVLLTMMQVNKGDGEVNLLSTKKLAMLSTVEVFKDIIPEYRVGVVDLQAQKVKKDTLQRVTYENTLLSYYKKYLKVLEVSTKALQKKKYGPKPSKEAVSLADVAVHCLCDALLTHPYFNFSTNIAQLLVVLLNHPKENIRKMVHQTFVKIFKTDKRMDISRHIVRHINHLVKKKSNFVFSEVITCLLSLQIKSINLNAEKEAELKQKKLEQHKSRLIAMSKRERKRKKKLVEVEKEMIEAKAEENKQTKNTKLTDTSKLVFTIYFRILKQNPNSRLLSATLEGLAKFAHIINVEFFSDLVEVLNRLIEEASLGYREQLHCIQTVFTILSGQGEVLNIDPARFYTHLYKNLLFVNAGRRSNDMESIINTLENVLIRRRKNITNSRYLAFLKRMMSLSLQVLHNGTIGCLGIVKNAMQLNSSLDILLDVETKIGSGKFDPMIEEPEFCNANCTSLFELGLLRRHYHPIVAKMANHIAAGVPSMGAGMLEPVLAKMTPIDLLLNYDSSEMAFNPPIPSPPKEAKPKLRPGKHVYRNKDLEYICKKHFELPAGSNARKLNAEDLTFNFYSDFVAK